MHGPEIDVSVGGHSPGDRRRMFPASPGPNMPPPASNRVAISVCPTLASGIPQEFRHAPTPTRRARRDGVRGRAGAVFDVVSRLTTPQIGVSSVSWTLATAGDLHTVISPGSTHGRSASPSPSTRRTSPSSTAPVSGRSTPSPVRRTTPGSSCGTPERWSGGRSAWSGSPPTPGRHRRRWPSSTWATGSRSRGRVALGARCLSRVAPRDHEDRNLTHQVRALPRAAELLDRLSPWRETGAPRASAPTYQATGYGDSATPPWKVGGRDPLTRGDDRTRPLT